MFFQNEFSCFHLLSVVRLKQQRHKENTERRAFNALSMRFKADTKLIVKDEEYSMKDNAVLFVPANMGYTRITKCDDLIAIHFRIVDGAEKKFAYFYPENPEKLQELFFEIYEVWSKKQRGYQYKCQALLYEIFLQCHLQTAPPMDKQALSIQKSVDYLLRYFSQPDLTVRRLAELSYMSETYFRHLFEQRFSLSPRKYIMKLRMEKALGLLSSGYYSLMEISQESGFNDYKYFLYSFRQFTGMTPAQYKKNVLSKELHPH